MSTPLHPAPAPEFPELPAGIEPHGARRWRPHHALVALGVALAAVVLLGGLVLAVGTALGADADTPALNIAALLVQDACFVAAAILAARSAGRVRAADFGLRPAPRWAWFAVPPLWLLFPLLTYLWVQLIGADPEQDALPVDLGVDESAVFLVLAALLICVGAPLVEELFFRGFLFPALRSWKGTWPAAIVVGALFGAAHALGSDPAYLVPLGLFGLGLCLIYQWTGSLWPGIGLHALNNSIAFGALQEWDWQTVPLLAGVGLVLLLTARAVHVTARR
jgi:uncharacterized protein